MRVLFVVIATLVALVGNAAVAADGKLSFKRTAVVDVPYGGDLKEVYILDIQVLDGDGADDFAVSGGIYDDGLEPLHSFIVRNNTDTGKPQLFDLEESGLTRSAWHGLFLREGPDQQLYFVLGRNGEAANRKGEKTTIFRVDVEGQSLSTEPVFTAFQARLTMTVTGCDIDADGTTEIFLNNYGAPQRADFNSPIVIRLVEEKFRPTSALKWLPWLADYGAHNSINFADIDGDGDCDALAALEVAKWTDSDQPTFPGQNRSYALLNEGGAFSFKPIEVPNRISGTTTPHSIS